MAARIADRLRDQTLSTAGDTTGHVPVDLPDQDLQVLREAMADKCGVVRDAAGLSALIETIDTLQDQRGDARALVAARLIAEAALARTESRGGHFRSDFPDAAPDAKRTFIQRPDTPALTEEAIQ